MSKIPSNGLVTPTQGQVNIECHLEGLGKAPLLACLRILPTKKACVSHACKNRIPNLGKLFLFLENHSETLPIGRCRFRKTP